MLLVLIFALVVVLATRFRPRGLQRGFVNGTLLVTGVSPRPPEGGTQFVTIAGVLDGPTVSEHAVYRRMGADVDHWPAVGQLLPVVYSPKNPDNWEFAPGDPDDGRLSGHDT